VGAGVTSPTPSGPEVPKEQMVMRHLVSLTYEEPLTPNLHRFVEGVLDDRLIGQRCPSCQRVYVPSKGFCPLCVVSMGTEHELDVAQTGTLTSFTIIAPLQYYGQEASEPFVYASVLLDGADTPLSGMDVTGVPHDELRSGLRVRAVWRPHAERRVEQISNRGWGGLDAVIASFEATGEPDASEDDYEEFMF
jgi:uncharacterized OB-fold protein